MPLVFLLAPWGLKWHIAAHRGGDATVNTKLALLP